MALLNDGRSALQRLCSLEATKNGANESMALDNILQHLECKSTDIANLADSFKTMSDMGISITQFPDMAEVMRSIQSACNEFKTTPQVDTLTNKDLWKKIKKGLDLFIDNAKKIQRNDWEKYFDANYSPSQTPVQRESTLAYTLQNQSELKKYKEIYPQLIAYRTRWPLNAEDLSEISRLSNEIKGLVFQVNLPDFINAFFTAIEGDRASLDFLTPDVLTWLSANKQLSSYIVKVRQ
ncbi:hypothetical protein [Chlorobium phaeovibrioides]|uniref:hypothetical protein n=1 Tax=Chlorobium phaeovibrioides TaxID=1094 RepID=UPI0012307729|nr:hypothetical protein [Chlorobium phaeovibrioides]QEQ57702.1 hypothetical protein FNV82_09415 [Chlorobium phaeovibrioides]